MSIMDPHNNIFTRLQNGALWIFLVLLVLAVCGIPTAFALMN
jgi:hypothetical protein